MAADEPRPKRTGRAAFVAAFGIWLSQALTLALVFMPFWNASGSDSKPEGVLEGYGPALVGLLVAPAAAALVGWVLAWSMRLRTAGLYALSPVAALASLAFCIWSYESLIVAAFLIGTAWNLGVVPLAERNVRPQTDAGST